MKRILLTRSEEENTKINAKFDGFEVISSPMIIYKDLPIDWKEFEDFSTLIITSKYAAQLVSKYYPYRILALVVGEESANIIKANPNITLGGVFDNVEDLIFRHCENSLSRAKRGEPESCELKARSISSGLPRCIKDTSRNNGRILYLSGNNITEEIPNVTRKVIYYTEYVEALNPQIYEGPIDYVLIYSKNSANNLIKLLKNHNLLQNIENSVSISLSDKIAIVMKNYVSKVIYPDKPIADEMIKLLFEYERQER